MVIAGLAAWFLTGSLFGIRINGRNVDWDLGLNIGSFEVLSGPYSLVGEYSADAGGVDSIFVDWVAGEITVRPYDGNVIQVNEYAQRELRDNERLTLSDAGGTLTVRYRERGISGNMPSKRVEVLVPRTLSENLGSLSVDSSSGRVSASGFNANIFTVNSMSGSVDISNIVSQTLFIDSSSGAITLASVNSGSVTIHSMSGTIRITDTDARTLEIDSSSGTMNASGTFDNVDLRSMSGRMTLNNAAFRSAVKTNSSSGRQELTGSFDSVTIESMSGSVEIRSATVPASLDINSSSGGITIAVPNEGEVRVRHSASSGRLSSDIPIVIVQGGSAQFNITTMSGSTRIIELD